MWKVATAGREGPALAVVRIAVAILILIHGVFRAVSGGAAPFGGWLESQGWPMGLAIAWAITVYEMTAPLLLIAGRFVTPAALGHVFILGMGAWMVHLPSGWFVVGAGRNGMEYSVLLIVCLLAVAWAHAPWGRKPV
jgi:putative oxidoreductase